MVTRDVHSNSDIWPTPEDKKWLMSTDVECPFCYPRSRRSMDYKGLDIQADRMPLGELHLLISQRFAEIQSYDSEHERIENLHRISKRYPEEFNMIVDGIDDLVGDVREHYKSSRGFEFRGLFIVEHGQFSKSMEHFHIHLIRPEKPSLVRSAIDEFQMEEFPTLSNAMFELYEGDIQENDYMLIAVPYKTKTYAVMEQGIDESQFFRKWLGERQDLKWDNKRIEDVLRKGNYSRVKRQMEFLRGLEESI